MDIYNVTILKWNEHNPKHKKGYSYFKLSNAFFSDPKIARLKPIEVNLFIYLLCIMSESSTNQCQIHVKSVPKQFRISARMMQNCLSQLESFQLVSVEKQPLIKDNISKVTEGSKTPPVKPKSENKVPITREAWESYRKCYLANYGIEPLRNAKTNAQISQLVTRLGKQDAPLVIEFYFKVQNDYYSNKKHPVDCLLKDAEELRTRWLTGDTKLKTSRFTQKQQQSPLGEF